MGMLFAHQGDVGFRKMDSVPSGEKVSVDCEGKIVLAYGEVTGHAHTISAYGVEKAVAELIRTSEGREYLTLEDSATVTHQEHAPIMLPAGIYEIVHQREYSPVEGIIRRVED